MLSCRPALLLVWNTLPFMYLLPIILEKPTHLFKETFLPPSLALGRRFVYSLGHRSQHILGSLCMCLLNKRINEPLTKTLGHQKEKKSCSSNKSRLCFCFSLQTPTHVQKCCLLPLYLISSLAQNKILESHFLSLLTL